MLSRFALVNVLTLAIRQVSTQSISDIPQCAEKAAFSSISSTGCQLTDITCLCKNQSFMLSLLPVVKNDCSPADLQKTIDFTESLCDSVGITVTVPTSTASATPSPTASPSPSTTLTGTPFPLFTSRLVSYNKTASASNVASNKPASTASNTLANASPAPSSGTATFTGVATRYYAFGVWAGALPATIVLFLL